MSEWLTTGEIKNPIKFCDDVILIQLGDNLVTKISRSSFEKIEHLSGRFYEHRCADTGSCYVRFAHSQKGGKKAKQSQLHRLITDAPKNKVVDHLNHDTLDNTNQNLRVCEPYVNSQNLKGPNAKNKTGVRGVYHYKGKYAARVQLKRKRIFLGYFDRLEDAKRAVEEEREKWGMERRSS